MTPGIRSRAGKTRVIFESPVLYSIAAALAPAKSTGRPRAYPNAVLLGMSLLVSAFDSYQDMVEEFHDDPALWQLVVAGARTHTPHALIPDTPPTRRQILYFERNYLAEVEGLRHLSEEMTRHAVELAHLLGLGDAHSGGSLTSPVPEQMMTADGTTFPSLFRSGDPHAVDRATGERRTVRHDPEALTHTSGDGRRVRGHKFAIITARQPGPDRPRVILAVDLVNNDEAAAAMSGVERVQRLGLGSVGIIYDGALRGAHHAELVKKWGLLLVNRVARKNSGDAASKECHIDTATCDCGQVTEFRTRNGGIHTTITLAGGERHLSPLTNRRILRRKNSDGSFRMYVQGNYVCVCGETRNYRSSLFSSPQDERRGLNRSEHVRGIPEDDPAFAGLYGPLRSEIEGFNNTMKERWRNRRSRVVGAAANTVHVLCFALFRNVLTAHAYL